MIARQGLWNCNRDVQFNTIFTDSKPVSKRVTAKRNKYFLFFFFLFLFVGVCVYFNQAIKVRGIPHKWDVMF